MDYVKVEEIPSHKVEEYVKNKWVLIGECHEYGHIIYHMGYPAVQYIEDLKSIIAMYEERGYKQLMFEAVAKENDQVLDDYNDYGVYDNDANDHTGKFISKYESIVKNRVVKYSKEPVNQRNYF